MAAVAADSTAAVEADSTVEGAVMAVWGVNK
jgi:hypothetical protein